MVTALQGPFLENRNQSQQQHKEHQSKESEQEVIHRSLEVVNHVGNERELIMPGSVIVRAIIVRMVESELGANSDEFIRPPSHADGMFGILCGKAGPGTHLV